MSRSHLILSLLTFLFLTGYGISTTVLAIELEPTVPAVVASMPQADPPVLTYTTFLPLILRPASLPLGAIALHTLGDSLTAGDGDDSPAGGGYPRRLIGEIQSPRPSSAVTNLGQSGWTSTDLINGLNGIPSQLDQTVAAHPTVACVWIGSNDLWYLYEFGNPTPADEAQDLQNFTNNLDTILSRLQGAGTTVFIALLDDQSQRPVASSGAFPGISVAERALMSQQISRYNQAISNKAAQYGATTADFYHTTIFTNPSTLAGDGNHPNAAGYDIITSIWFSAINPQLN